ncbi:hypothetical protein ETB97_011839 [Aspergillus alliaceus]|uniref:Uncharacterized protein n=1 Tax=Petromyces alliaceus TaxID=209559 RepID=A0A8H6A866_PETAA|nr:hypothetical protein ETB97_011839 [Aspergillus burnettii]
MAATANDFKLAGVAAGFTLGFGFLTVWNAIKLTRAHPTPYKSPFFIMVWGEIFVNLAIGIIGWLFLERVIPAGIPVFFTILFLWAFEIHFLMQILVNRVKIVAPKKSRILAVRWWTAGIITLINIAVFCIWIPAHLDPPPSQMYVTVNKYWDRISKILILLVDAALNIWFTQNVKRRLIKQHGLSKYVSLFQFNARLIVLSVCLDGLLIGLMSLPNPLVYIQFHPVVYMAKLNIELSLSELLKDTARFPVVGNAVLTSNRGAPQFWCSVLPTDGYALQDRKHTGSETQMPHMDYQPYTEGRILKTTDVQVVVE